MSKALEALIDEILTSEEVIQFKKLESLVLNNPKIKDILDHLHNVEKQAINARELGLENTYLAYKKEYDDIIKNFEDDVLISSYINAKIEVNNIIEMVKNIIENEINKAINN